MVATVLRNSSPVPPLKFTSTRRLMVSISLTSWSTCSGVGFQWWLWISMNGNFARSILCSLTMSVEVGLYSSMFGTCWDWVLAGRGQTSATEQMHASAAAEREMARQDFIAHAPRETRIVSHREAGKPKVRFLIAGQILTRHHSSLHGRRDIWRAGPPGWTTKLSEKLEPMPCSGSYNPGSTEKAMPGSSMV